MRTRLSGPCHRRRRQRDGQACFRRPARARNLAACRTCPAAGGARGSRERPPARCTGVLGVSRAPGELLRTRGPRFRAPGAGVCVRGACPTSPHSLDPRPAARQIPVHRAMACAGTERSPGFHVHLPRLHQCWRQRCARSPLETRQAPCTRPSVPTGPAVSYQVHTSTP